MENVMATFISQPRAKIKIARAERAIWESYRKPPSKRAASLDRAEAELGSALAAFPTASQVFTALEGGDEQSVFIDQTFEAHRLTHVALLRALEQRVLPKTIKTSDLASPFTGKALTFSFDGRQIKIECQDPQAGSDMQLIQPRDSQVQSISRPAVER